MNFKDGIKPLDMARGDPDTSALAEMESVLESAAPEVRAAFEAAAIPHWFDGRILKNLVHVDEKRAKQVLREICRLPIVELLSVRDGWQVSESTRLALRVHLAREEPDRFRSLSTRAAACFLGDEPELVIERLFHELVAAPDSAPWELYTVWMAWTRAGKDRCLQALGAMLRELLRLPELGPLPRGFASVCLGWIIQGRQSQDKIEALAREALTLFRQVNELKGEAEACSLLGQALQRRGSLPEALCEFEAAKRIMLQLTRREPFVAWHQDTFSFTGARALLYPTRFNEAFGLAMAEALMSGTPVICNDRGACPEIISPDVGFVCRQESDYRNAIERVTQISSRACRKKAMCEYHHQVMAKGFAREYEAEISQPTREALPPDVVASFSVTSGRGL